MSIHTRVQHPALCTTFVGVEHPLSTDDLPVVQFRGIKYASVPARFRQSKLFASYPALTDASRYGYVWAFFTAIEFTSHSPQTYLPSDKV
jgi:hypothetical protein